MWKGVCLMYYYYYPYPYGVQQTEPQWGWEDQRQGRFRQYVGTFVSATVEGLITTETRIFIHRSTMRGGRENVTLVFPRREGGTCTIRSATVPARRITVISGRDWENS